MLDIFAHHIIPAAFSVLPPKMNTAQAKTLLLSIGLQESGFKHRVQVGGPAHGAFQFERGGGVRGVLEHPMTRDHIQQCFRELNYSVLDAEDSYRAIEHNDVLATCFARLLLWSHPNPLPINYAGGWDYYLDTWRPGKPHPEKWQLNWIRAEQMVSMGRTI